MSLLGKGTLGLLLLLSVPARADQEPRLELVVFAGGHGFSKQSELGRAEFALDSSALFPSFIGGLRLSLLPVPRLALEIEAAVLPTQTHGHTADVVALAWRGHLLLHLADGQLRPFVLAGYGAMSIVSSSNTSPEAIAKDTDPMAHFGAGLKFDASDHWGLRGEGRVLLPPAVRSDGVTADWEVLVSVYARFGARRTTPPPPPPHAPAKLAPPEPPRDSDGDGIPDVIDRCPHEPEDMDGFEDADGCPDRDNDKDGLPDAEDRCPNEAGPKDNNGCPDKDSDMDGVVDRLDHCPNEPETKNGYQDEDGCPDEIPKAVKKYTGVIDGIYFATGKDTIKKPSFKVLDKAAAVLKEYDSVKLEISGHTDDRGSREMNLDLSQRRAEAVRRYLVGKGVAPERLTAKGFGPDRPIADNKTRGGRALNRRVEFNLIPLAEQPKLEP